MKLSLAIATNNEESNIVDCIQSCKGLVDEIVVVDGSSTDKTAELARQNGAKVIIAPNEKMFHINKQKAIEACSGEWILQLDADERVTPELASEIKNVLLMTDEEITSYQNNLKEKELFDRHQQLIQKNVFANTSVSLRAESKILSVNSAKQSQINNRIATSSFDKLRTPRNDAESGNDTQEKVFSFPSTSSGQAKLQVTSYKLQAKFNAFFIPRLNFFLGGYLRYGGVYPDGVIRLIRKGKAHLPCKSVHELMEVEGKTGWLAHPLIHKDSPTFSRYLARNSRYIDQLVGELKTSCNLKLETFNLPNQKLQATSYKFQTAIDWLIIKPISTFFSLLIRHKGILDGWRGVVFAFFSAIRFARAYGRYTMRG